MSYETVKIDELLYGSLKPNCPICEKNNQNSETTVYQGMITTLMTPNEYNDEHGHHIHDNNRVEDNWSCSNGHKFIKIRNNSCWCGWLQR